MPEKSARKAYMRPQQAKEPLPGQQSIFGDHVPGPDPEAEKQRQRAVDARMYGLERQLKRQMWAIEAYREMRERGVTMPDIAEAIGLQPVVDRATPRLKPWRLRPGTNMDIVATMLEDAGRRGASESEMVAHLQALGRLATAAQANRAVHWTVSELQRRTRFLTRKRRADGGRWYAFGRFDTWRA